MSQHPACGSSIHPTYSFSGYLLAPSMHQALSRCMDSGEQDPSPKGAEELTFRRGKRESACKQINKGTIVAGSVGRNEQARIAESEQAALPVGDSFSKKVHWMEEGVQVGKEQGIPDRVQQVQRP